MPAKYFIVERKADKEFLKLPITIQKRILRAYEILRMDPISGVKLHGELLGYFKYRVGDYRIIYQFNNKTSVIGVVKIEHRQGVYK